MNARAPRLPTALLFGGAVVVWLGERALVGPLRAVAAALAAAALLGSLVARALQLRRAPVEFRSAERRLLAFQTLVVLAFALQGAQSDLLFAAPTEPGVALPPWRVVLQCLWPILFLLGALPLLFLEWALAPMRRAGLAERRRSSEALAAGFSLAAATAFLFVLNFIAARLDVQRDFSFFRPARPSAATLNLVRGAEGDVDVHLFFPKPNDVLEEVEAYLAPLAAASPRLAVVRHDRFLEPALAETFEVRSDGVVVVAHGDRREQWTVGASRLTARRQLRELDRRFHERLTRVLNPPRVAYRTVGHGEVGSGAADAPSSRQLDEFARVLGFNVQPLGLPQGLANEVPGDAGMVLVLHPRKPFIPEEEASLLAYLERGGRLLLALDPALREPPENLLRALGLRFLAEPLANDREHVRQRHNASDRLLMVTAHFGRHPIVDALRRDGRTAVLLARSGRLERLPEPAAGKATPEIVMALHSAEDTWADRNGNLVFDTGTEQRGRFDLLAAVTGSQGGTADAAPAPPRAVVSADGELFSDPLMVSLGNQYLALDTLRWLAGDAEGQGPLDSVEDVPVLHTREQDVIWFYGCVFAVPAFVLLAGLGWLRIRAARTRRTA